MIRASVKQWLVATTLLGLGLLLAACMLSGPARAAEPGSAARRDERHALPGALRLLRASNSISQPSRTWSNM